MVVLLSRNKECRFIIIVGNKQWAIERLWQVICTRTQWTEYIKHILEKITVNPGDENAVTNSGVVDMAELFPYRVCDICLPPDETGKSKLPFHYHIEPEY